jgi:hypothetical protein
VRPTGLRGGGKTPVYANDRLYTRDFTSKLILDIKTRRLARQFRTDSLRRASP